MGEILGGFDSHRVQRRWGADELRAKDELLSKRELWVGCGVVLFFC